MKKVLWHETGTFIAGIIMSGPHAWPEPAWLAAIPEPDRENCRLRFLIALAALYANKEGSPVAMSKALGMNPTTLSAIKSKGKIAPETALRIETALGRDLFPWELFLPDLKLPLGE